MEQAKRLFRLLASCLIRRLLAVLVRRQPIDLELVERSVSCVVLQASDVLERVPIPTTSVGVEDHVVLSVRHGFVARIDAAAIPHCHADAMECDPTKVGALHRALGDKLR